MHRVALCVILFLILWLAFISCSRSPEESKELASFPLDSTEGVITRDGVSLDQEISSDGNGSLRINADKPVVVRLFEVSGLALEKARLIYQAKMRTENVQGQAYLEMWVRFPGKGEFFSRGVDQAVTGTTDWTSMETPFFLQKGEKADLAKLNLVVTGSGTVWVDEVRLVKGGL
jgi:hypothetical protein